jgi:hypothetical protein
MLCELVVIKVDGLQELDVFQEDEAKQMITLCDCLLGIDRTPESEGVFKRISQFNSK